MTKDDLVAKLKALETAKDFDEVHMDADELLLRFINIPEVTDAFNRIEKYYA